MLGKGKDFKAVCLSLTVFYFVVILNSSFISPSNKISKGQFIGEWLSNDVTLKSITFMSNNMLKIVSNSNESDIAMHYHYKIFNSKNNIYTIQFLKKNLFKEEYYVIKLVNAILKKSD